MNTMMLGVQMSDTLARRLAIILSLALLALILMTPSMMSSYVGLGGYISEKLLGDAAVPDSSLYLGESASGPVVIGSGPIVSTLAVNNATITAGVPTATLRGNLTSLNGMPRADVWWVWGYSPATMVNTTSVSTVTTTGDKTGVISGYNANIPVFYQFQSSTDGTSLGSVLSFQVGGGTGGQLLDALLPLIIAVGMFVFIISMTGNPLAALIGAVIGLMAFIIVQQMFGVL